MTTNSIDNIMQSSSKEKMRLNLIEQLIRKRKTIRDITIGQIDDLIVYCENQLHKIGDEQSITAGASLSSPIQLWQTKIMDLKTARIGEQKELFRDTLMLRNEWVRTLLDYMEEKQMQYIIGNSSNDQ